MSDLGKHLIKLTNERRSYILRYLPRHLTYLREVDRLYRLLTDIFFLEAKTQDVSVFDLAADFLHALKVTPHEHPHQEILSLLEEAIHRNLHFIDRHVKDYPQALFQCLWNLCWWYDCPGLDDYYHYSYEDYEMPSLLSCGSGLYRLMVSWRKQKEQSLEHFYWIRSLRPPHLRLGGANSMVLRGSGSAIFDIAFSMEGDQLITAENQMMHLWNIASGNKLLMIDTGEWDSRSVAYSPNRREVSVAGSDGFVHIFDTTNWYEIRHIKVCEGTLHSVVYSQDGSRLAAAGIKGLRIWQGKDYSELLHINYQIDVVEKKFLKSIAISPNGRQIAVAFGGINTFMQLLEINNAKELYQILLSDWPRCLEFTPDGQRVAVNVVLAPRIDQSPPEWGIQVCEADCGEVLFNLGSHSEPVSSISYSFDGKLIATGSQDGNIRLWNAETGTQLRTFQGHTDEIMSLVFSPCKSRLASGSADGSVYLWDLSIKQQTIWQRNGDEDRSVSVSFSSDGSCIVTGSHGYGKIHVWNTKNGMYTHSHLQQDIGGSTDVYYSPDGQRIIGTNFDSIKIWDARDGCHLLTITPKTDAVSIDHIRYFQNSHRIIGAVTTIDYNEEIIIWDAENGNELLGIDLGNESLSGLALSHDEKQIFGVFPKKSIHMWDADTGNQIAVMKFPEHFENIAFFPSGVAFVTGGEYSKNTQIWDRETCQLLWQISSCVDLQAVAKRLPFLATNEGGETVIFKQKTGKPIAWFNERIRSVTTHPDGIIWAGIAGLYLQIVKLEGITDVIAIT